MVSEQFPFVTQAYELCFFYFCGIIVYTTGVKCEACESNNAAASFHLPRAN